MAGSDKLEINKRVRTMLEWYLDDHTYSDIISSAQVKFTIGERQAKRYMKMVHDLISQSTEETTVKRINFHVQRRMKLLRDMDPGAKKTPQGVSAANSVLDSIAKIERIMVNKLEVGSDPENPFKTEVKTVVEFRDYKGE